MSQALCDEIEHLFAIVTVADMAIATQKLRNTTHKVDEGNERIGRSSVTDGDGEQFWQQVRKHVTAAQRSKLMWSAGLKARNKNYNAK